MLHLPITRALLSVTDKTGLIEFAGALQAAGVELVSTGGTRRTLLQAGLPVTAVSQVTGFPEILDGRVKTLHPHIHAGILADKDNPEHMATLTRLGVPAFELICVNLYNFEQAVTQRLNLKAAVEQIDIGGPTLLRAAAKNFHSVLVVPDPADYGRVLDELKTGGFAVGLALRQEMAVKTFSLVSEYDAAIAEYLGRAQA